MKSKTKSALYNRLANSHSKNEMRSIIKENNDWQTLKLLCLESGAPAGITKLTTIASIVQRFEYLIKDAFRQAKKQGKSEIFLGGVRRLVG